MANQTAPFFQYAGVQLDDIKTLSFHQQPEYDTTGIDYTGTKVTITLRAVFAAGLQPNSEGGLSPAEIMTQVRASLLKPHQLLIYRINSDTIISSPPSGSKQDAKNGPLPRSLNIAQVTPTVFIIEYTIDTWIWECGKGDTPAYISNRWSERVTIDHNFMSIITRTGVLIFRGDKLKTIAHEQIDEMRPVIVSGRGGWPATTCPLRVGFLRTRSEYTVTPDGLSIQYVIEDTEQYAMPPPPLTKFECDYQVMNHKGTVYDEEVSVRVWGPKPGTDARYTSGKTNLVIAAVAIAAERMGRIEDNSDGMVNFNPRSSACIRNAALAEKLHENFIELKIQWQRVKWTRFTYGILSNNSSGPGAKLIGGGTSTGKSFDPPYAGVRPQDIPDPGVRGSAGLLILQQTMGDPCLQAALAPQPAKPPKSTTPKTSPTPSRILVVPELPTAITLYRPDGLSGPGSAPANSASFYTDYIIDTDYEQQLWTFQMPVASSVVVNASFATVASPTWRKVVRWSAERLGKQPALPDPDSGDTNEVLLDCKINPISPDVETDGVSRVWRVSGVYTYGLIDPSKASLTAGNLPYLTTSFADSQIPTSQFVKGITGPSTRPALQEGIIPED